MLAECNARTVGKLIVVTLGMFGFAFALVPFYYKICEVTGINSGAEQTLARNTQVDSSRTVMLQFDANVNADLPWRFRPLTTSVSVHPGELVQVEYEVTNTSDRPLVGRAVPSYGPARAAAFFKKIECFCFREQALEPGESRRMPVLIVLDPGVDRDVHTVTLSYTFFSLDEKERATASPGPQRHG